MATRFILSKAHTWQSGTSNSPSTDVAIMNSEAAAQKLALSQHKSQEIARIQVEPVEQLLRHEASATSKSEAKRDVPSPPIPSFCWAHGSRAPPQPLLEATLQRCQPRQCLGSPRSALMDNVRRRLVTPPPRLKVSPFPPQIPTNTKVKGQQDFPKTPYPIIFEPSPKPPLIKGIPLQPPSQQKTCQKGAFLLA